MISFTIFADKKGQQCQNMLRVQEIIIYISVLLWLKFLLWSFHLLAWTLSNQQPINQSYAFILQFLSMLPLDVWNVQWILYTGNKMLNWSIWQVILNNLKKKIKLLDPVCNLILGLGCLLSNILAYHLQKSFFLPTASLVLWKYARLECFWLWGWSLWLG